MPKKIERFTPFSRVAFSIAQQTAEGFRHKTIGPEHLLVGLICAAGVAGDLLRGLALESETVKSWIEQGYVDTQQNSGGNIELADSTKRLLERTVLEAQLMNHTNIGTGHLLLALLWLAPESVSKALAYLDLSASQLRTFIKVAMLTYEDKRDMPRLADTTISRPAEQVTALWWYRFTAKLMQLIGVEPPDPISSLDANTVRKNLIELITDMSRQGKPNPRLYHYRGTVYARWDEYQAAYQDYSEAIRLKPDFELAYLNRGVVQNCAKNYTGAIADFTTMIERKYLEPFGHVNRGFSYLALLDYERSMADFQEAIRLKPDDPWGYIGRGSIYLSNRELDRAMVEFESGLQRDPNNSQALDNRGTARAHLEQYSLAEADFREVLRQHPEKSRSHSNLGWLCRLRQEYDKAIEYCDKAIRLDAQNGPAYYSRGAARAGKGDVQGAIADFRQSLALWTNINTKLCAPLADEMQTYLTQHADSTNP